MADSADRGKPDVPAHVAGSGIQAPGRSSGVPPVRRSTPGTKRAASGAMSGVSRPKKAPQGKTVAGRPARNPSRPPLTPRDADAGRTTGSDPAADRTTSAAIPGAALAEAPKPAAAPSQSGGLGPMILAGVVAAAVGAGGMFIAVRQGAVSVIDAPEAPSAELGALDKRLDAQMAELAGLRAELASRDEALAALRDEMTAGDAGAGDARTVIEERLAALAAEVEAAQSQTIPQAELPQEVVDAYERRLAGMQDGLDARLADIEA